MLPARAAIMPKSDEDGGAAKMPMIDSPRFHVTLRPRLIRHGDARAARLCFCHV